ncbi:hypothetical protein GCM10009785_14390 [Brooklawnia cerclae]
MDNEMVTHPPVVLARPGARVYGQTRMEPVRERGVRAKPGLVAVCCATTLVSACSLTGDPTERALDRIVEDAGGRLVTAVSLGDGAQDVGAVVRLPGGDVAVDAEGRSDPAVDGQLRPSGASLVDDLDLDALTARLDAVRASCDAEPGVEAQLSPAGALFVYSTCAGEPGPTVSVAGVEGATELDFTTIDGVAQLLREAAVAVPGAAAWQVSIPGPSSPRGATARAEGGLWGLPDGSSCQVVYERLERPQSGEAPWRYRCDGYGQQRSTSSDVQQQFVPTTVDAQAVVDAMALAVQRGGFTHDEVMYYVVTDMLVDGPVVIAMTTDRSSTVALA